MSINEGPSRIDHLLSPKEKEALAPASAAGWPDCLLCAMAGKGIAPSTVSLICP